MPKAGNLNLMERVQAARAAMYQRWRVTLETRTRIYGGVPRNPDVIRDWIVTRTGHDDALTDEQVADVKATVEPSMEKVWTTFQADEHGIMFPARNLKAAIRESASALGLLGSVTGLRQVLQHSLTVEPDPLRLFRGEPGAIVLKPDGFEDRAIHVLGPRGPRTALKRLDYVEPPVGIVFEIVLALPSLAAAGVPDAKAPRKADLPDEVLVRILAHLEQEIGLGADRSMGHGRVRVVEFAEIEPK